MLSDLQQQADGRGTIAGSPIEDFLSIAGYEPEGGGGSSEFSTAQVTIIGDEGATNFVIPYLPYIDEGAINVCINDGVQADNSHTYSVALYENTVITYIFDTVTATSGDVTVDDGLVTITGDCSMTIHPA